MRTSFLEKLIDNLSGGSKVTFYRSTLLFCFLVPIVCLGAINYARTYHETTNDLLVQRKTIAHLAATLVHERLNDFVNLGISLAARKLTIEGVENGNWPEALANVSDVLDQFSFLDRILLIDPQGTIRAAIPSSNTADIGQNKVNSNWYQNITRQGAPHVSSFYQSRFKPDVYIVSVSIPIKHKRSVIQPDPSAPINQPALTSAILQLQFKPDFFYIWLQDIDKGESGAIYIVDQSGQAINATSSSDKMKVVDLHSDPLILDLLAGHAKASIDSIRIEHKDRVTAYEPVSEYGWGVIVTQSAAKAFLKRDAALTGLIVTYTIILLFALTFGIFILYALTVQKKLGKMISQLMRAVEQSPATIVITNTRGKIEYVNPKFTQLTGYDFAEVFGKDMSILKSGHQPAEFYKDLWDTILAGREWSGELNNKKKNGDFFWVIASISAVTDGQGQITNYVCVMEDITQEKYLREQLAIKAHEWETTFNAIPDLISIHDIDFNIVRVNTAYANFFKLSLEEIIGKKCFSIVHSTTCPATDCPHKKTMLSHKPEHVEYFEPCFNLYLEVSTSPIIDNKGNLTGSVHIIKDITQRKKAIENITKAVAIKSEFTSMVSHELRTPLGPIKEGAGIILDGLVGDINQEQRDLLNIVKSNADRLHRLIDNVLDFQKLESGRMSFDLRENSICDVIHEVAGAMVLMARQKQLELTTECDPSIPDINFDRDKIVQVMTNLVNNAIKFTDHGSIKIRGIKEENMVHVIIEDTGPGIKQDDIPKLFHSFQQLHDLNNRKPGGTGLGLAISREIIQLHHGKIWAESEPGKGSSFHFQLLFVDRRSPYA